ncbi:GNAT family N-acetyltransferase [Cellulomonas sp. PS-H5]|uniref:GNAT family N-acetyltransferase n=1 Tax=Cellulomonas sp. PS-H5 TaxID=2820400 RepID=UPI001C4F70D1|nr:GNAT family N-acetyltransferase [Cellulomonas sp. PS-H5]MBW0253983.1 GNAT family N-acetyltransferase [Cellulomonas sp. PS-H5]
MEVDLRDPCDEDLRARARRELAGVPVNTGFARAVLDGTAPGALWCDRADAPRAFHAVHGYGMSLVWGPAVDEAFDAVLVRLRGGAGPAEEWLQVDPRWTGLGWDAALRAVPFDAPGAAAPGAAARHVRLNFRHDPAAPRAARPLPSGWRTRAATAADFGWSGSVAPAGFWPDDAAFLAHGGGVVAERAADGAVGAIAFTSYRTGDELEIGIETAAPFRARGLAASVAGAFVDAVLGAGLTPVWSCREDNAASVRVALSAGFRPTVRLPYYHLRRTG